MAKGVGLRLLSRRGSWVQIPPSAPSFALRILNQGYCSQDLFILFTNSAGKHIIQVKALLGNFQRKLLTQKNQKHYALGLLF